MNRYISALLLLGLVSCQDRYDAEKRILLDLHVTDQQGNSLAGKHMEIFADDGSDYYIGGDSDLITYGNTDSNGNIRLVFPVRENYASVYALNFEGDDEFEQTSYTLIKESDCVDYKVPVSALTLLRAEETVTLSIESVPVSNQQLFWLTIEGPHSGNIAYSMPESDFDSNSYYYSDFQVAKNSSILIKYITNLNGALTRHEQTVEIGTEDVQYVLNY
ncbi:hypothetical protein [Flavobacterium silvaticum]|uniref:Uncharacterized protein n=1 Tax=Flavobacterium silvaticum TaxID=1852020 RepID=A0A972JJ91_9FLAO|nr:hypothetical protein [Flavobacterium silvaticum]NMH29113.1 hypothetical protein [Flavobacterium silvaticum]